VIARHPAAEAMVDALAVIGMEARRLLAMERAAGPEIAALRLALARSPTSGTDAALLVGSFVGSGIVGGVSGLLAALGADLGSAIVVKLLSFDLSLLIPLCLVVGTGLFMTTENRNWLQFGRILIGVGLLILSLKLIGEASHPLRDSQTTCRS
jgi:phosphate:Na+ symporter